MDRVTELVCQRSWVRAQTCSVVNKISFKALVYTLREDCPLVALFLL